MRSDVAPDLNPCYYRHHRYKPSGVRRHGLSAVVVLFAELRGSIGDGDTDVAVGDNRSHMRSYGGPHVLWSGPAHPYPKREPAARTRRLKSPGDLHGGIPAPRTSRLRVAHKRQTQRPRTISGSWPLASRFKTAHCGRRGT